MFSGLPFQKFKENSSYRSSDSYARILASRFIKGLAFIKVNGFLSIKLPSNYPSTVSHIGHSMLVLRSDVCYLRVPFLVNYLYNGENGPPNQPSWASTPRLGPI